MLYHPPKKTRGEQGGNGRNTVKKPEVGTKGVDKRQDLGGFDLNKEAEGGEDTRQNKKNMDIPSEVHMRDNPQFDKGDAETTDPRDDEEERTVGDVTVEGENNENTGIPGKSGAVNGHRELVNDGGTAAREGGTQNPGGGSSKGEGVANIVKNLEKGRNVAAEIGNKRPTKPNWKDAARLGNKSVMKRPASPKRKVGDDFTLSPPPTQVESSKGGVKSRAVNLEKRIIQALTNNKEDESSSKKPIAKTVAPDDQGRRAQ